MSTLAELKNLTKQERALLNALIGRTVDDNVIASNPAIFLEIFSGAHMVLYDNGDLYKDLQQHFPNLTERYSSHASSESQYSFWDDQVCECLFSTRKLTDKEKTKYPTINTLSWVQFERNNTNTLWSFIKHTIDYLIYKCTGKNVGPMGLSNYTEKKPYVLDNALKGVEFHPKEQSTATYKKIYQKITSTT